MQNHLIRHLVFTFLIFFARAAYSQNNAALLDLLVHKKVITSQEADAVRDELDRQTADASAGKLKLADPVTKLTFSGDLRLRYQYDRTDLQAFSGGKDFENANQRSRWRYRLRLNAMFELGPTLFAGVTLGTGHASDSGNQTFDNGFTNSSIYIHRAFLGWKPADCLTVIAGKQDNIFYSTDLVWDNVDVTPAGLTEVVRLEKLLGGRSDAKDGKNSPQNWTLALNLAQYYYSDNNEFAADSDSKTDAYILGGQLEGSYRFSRAKITFAPAIYFFNAASLTGFDNNTSFVDSPEVSGASRKLTLLTAPGDLAFKVAGIPVKAYWDFAWNLQGKGRADDVYHIYTTAADGSVHYQHSAQDDFAWLTGLQFGENKKSGDISLNVNYRQLGIASVDPNLNDPNFALGLLNTQGFKFSVQYNFTESLTASVNYYYAWNLRKNLLEGEATGGQKIANGNNIQVLQFDLMLKF